MNPPAQPVLAHLPRGDARIARRLLTLDSSAIAFRKSFAIAAVALGFAWCMLAGDTAAAQTELIDTPAPPSILVSAQWQLAIFTNPAATGLTISTAAGTVQFQAQKPLLLEVLDVSGATNWLAANYSSVMPVDGALQCFGQIQTASHTCFSFTDAYKIAPATGSYVLQRQVTVTNPNASDAGFLTRFSLAAAVPVPLRQQEVFIPGVWYLHNAHVPAQAFAADLSDNVFLIREDRMALPLVMLRNPGSGATITLIHSHPDGATTLADYAPGRVIDARIQVASLGLWSHEDPAVSFCYPALEGERTYFRDRASRRGSRDTKRWTERFHPVQTNVDHAYQITIALGETPDFATAMRQTWRTAYDQSPPVIAPADVPASYEASIRLIADWSKSYSRGAGLPFRLRLPGGELEGPEFVNFQMGFIGQQLPLAYHLLRYGLQHHDAAILAKGEAMADFWASNSATPSGLPRVWFDVHPQPHWREYNTFLRIASDGMIGALRAWDVMQAAGRPKPDWLRFCHGFGDWLVSNQNADGSWYREYDWQGQPVNRGQENTTHPIRFLVDLARATGENKYLAAALRAGEWSYTHIHQPFVYVGGTADNPNVMDKEAGFLALDAFLALHDATGDQRWLDAARQAGDYTETWVYSWNIPIPTEDRAVTYPQGASTTGFSLIATGHSGADLFMAAAPFYYYRLYLATGDPHYAEMARQLLYNTKQAMDINGSLGYGHTGLCTEALSLAPPRGHGVDTWLPWLTWGMIQPVTQLQDAYGMMDTPIVTEASRLAELRAQDAAFGRTGGLRSPPPNALPAAETK